MPNSKEAAALAVFSLLMSGCASSLVVYETPLQLSADSEFTCETGNRPSAQSFTDSAKTKSLSRCAFQAPEVCKASLKYREQVGLVFNIDREGMPKNIGVVETSNECLNAGAVNTLSLWRYEPSDQPELRVKVTFRIVRHSSAYEFQTILQNATRN